MAFINVFGTMFSGRSYKNNWHLMSVFHNEFHVTRQVDGYICFSQCLTQLKPRAHNHPGCKAGTVFQEVALASLAFQHFREASAEDCGCHCQLPCCMADSRSDMIVDAAITTSEKTKMCLVFLI